MNHYTDEETGINYISCYVLEVGDYGGSGSMGEANINSLQDTEGAWVMYQYPGHRTLWLPDTEENRELITGLERDYPVVDDEEVSRVEMEWEMEAWNDYGIADLSMELSRKHNMERLADELHELDKDVAYSIYRDAMEKDNEYPAYEYSGAYIRLDRIALTYARLTVEYMLDSADTVYAPAILEYCAVVICDSQFDTEDAVDRMVMCDWLTDNEYQRYAYYLRQHHITATL